MDLWMVAAAAGAGYLAKYWQNIVKDKEGSPGTHSGRVFTDEPESLSLIKRLHDKTCPTKKVSRAEGTGRHFSDNGEGYHTGETSGRDKETNYASIPDHGNQSERFEDGNVPSSSMSQLYRNHDIVEDYKDADMDVIPEHSAWEMRASQGSRCEKSLRSKRLHLQYVKPRTSLDSCLLAQMHREDAELEEYLLTPLSSPCTPSLRPFLVTDGKRIISRARAEVRGGLLKEDRSRIDQVFGLPHLPQIIADDYSRQKSKTGNNQLTKSHYISKTLQFDAEEGSSSGQALFFLGISIGIIWSIVANTLELGKLKEQLKYSENLVEDLQEELEMKDSLTVKELANDDDSQDIQESSSSIEKMNLFPYQADTKVLVSYVDNQSKSPKKDESISNIEAELEAELERLELSIAGSTLRGTLLDNEELGQGFDEDIMAELVHGELQAELVRGESSSEPTLDRGSHSSETPRTIRDGFSPRELSLRLHGVIQSRLENRVMELEAELVQSQRRIKQLESERIAFCREVSHSNSSSRCSPRAIEALVPIVQPLVMNLSGDALDAYNEAFDELNKVEGSENESSTVLVDSKQCSLFQSNQGIDGRQSEFPNERMTWLSSNREEALPISITGIPSSEDSPNDYYDNDYDIDGDLLLIKQIVEKARQGSPAILKAQRAMVSSDREK